MGSGPRIAKLRKAMKRGSVEEIVRAMLNLKYREDKASTHGENISKETNRALKQIKHKCDLDRVRRALKLAKEEAGPVWDIGPDDISKLAQDTNKLVPNPNPEGIGGLKLAKADNDELNDKTQKTQE